ncbi:histone acetyltransferase type B catalytic subunit-like isoform X1 [Cimex lectularius]|uniref:Histone acetyltransferase type B catalytic subunit n=2 Tax=Cimex lectularius TaxID=79782 RepID=A0A8I6RQA3_CIMLE|nr:histone acetyltransferase type B catalytic subunit-like isoform X1 [Cimex lectularius]
MDVSLFTRDRQVKNKRVNKRKLKMSLRSIKQEFITSSNRAVEFKLIRNACDLWNDNGIFRPKMSHQIFGEEEQIYGYENLVIKVNYAAASLTIFISIYYKERLEDAMPANIMKTLADKYECRNFVTNINEFERLLKNEESFKPFGDLLNKFTIEKSESSLHTFSIYKCSAETTGFLEYHSKMQTFLLWFIDAASFINTNDKSWKFYVIYENYNSANNTPQYAFVGYFTVYEFYCYPDKIRPRISQALILPPFQRMGLCAKLIKTVQMHYSSMKEVFDITVEDPDISFQRVRDYVDCSNCLHLVSFQPERLCAGFHNDMIEEARIKHKINKKQVRRIYEILRFYTTNIYNETQYKEYVQEVHKRLNAEFQRRNINLLKTNRACLKQKQISTQLKKIVPKLNEEYTKVLNRIMEYPLEY